MELVAVMQEECETLEDSRWGRGGNGNKRERLTGQSGWWAP